MHLADYLKGELIKRKENGEGRKAVNLICVRCVAGMKKNKKYL
jgi:hypothetical protein